MECLESVWFYRLRLVRLVWAKLRACRWTRSSIFKFCFQLAKALTNAKTTQEDILQELNHLERRSRRKDVDLCGMFFKITRSKRLDSCPIDMVQLQPGDMRAHGSAKAVLADDFFPKKSVQKDEYQSEVIERAIQALRGREDF